MAKVIANLMTHNLMKWLLNIYQECCAATQYVKMSKPKRIHKAGLKADQMLQISPHNSKYVCHGIHNYEVHVVQTMCRVLPMCLVHVPRQYPVVIIKLAQQQETVARWPSLMVCAEQDFCSLARKHIVYAALLFKSIRFSRLFNHCGCRKAWHQQRTSCAVLVSTRLTSLRFSECVKRPQNGTQRQAQRSSEN